MKVVIFIAGLLSTVQCQPEQPYADEEKNVALAKAMFAAFNRHDWQEMANSYSEPASFLDPSFGTDYVNKSRVEVATKYELMEKNFPDIHDELIGIYPSQNKVIVEFVSTGATPDGIKFKLPIITVLTIKNGLIVKDGTYYDQN